MTAWCSLSWAYCGPHLLQDLAAASGSHLVQNEENVHEQGEEQQRRQAPNGLGGCILATQDQDAQQQEQKVGDHTTDDGREEPGGLQHQQQQHGRCSGVSAVVGHMLAICSCSIKLSHMHASALQRCSTQADQPGCWASGWEEMITRDGPEVTPPTHCSPPADSVSSNKIILHHVRLQDMQDVPLAILQPLRSLGVIMLSVPIMDAARQLTTITTTPV